MNNDAVLHFLDLARAGQNSTSSRGEWVCYKLAAALYDINDDLMLLDAHAAQGAAELIRGAVGPFSSTRAKQVIYLMIAEAGRKPRKRGT